MSLFSTLLFFSLVFLSSSFRCISKATITRGTGRIFDWLKIRAFINRCSVHTEPPYRDGSRGRVPGVLTAPLEMNCSFLIQLVFCKIWPEICMICILSSSHYVIAKSKAFVFVFAFKICLYVINQLRHSLVCTPS